VSDGASSCPVLAIVGPTASGKSDVAMELAQRLDGEIVSCDSVQVYRGFVIGCAKPSAAERARVAHHLVDVVDWHQPFDAQRYRTLASAAIAAIKGLGRLPIVCGGTGLWLRALRFGLVDAPGADPVLREELAQAEAVDPGSLFERLRTLDPDAAASIGPRNVRRIIRALEIQIATGTPPSRLRAAHAFAAEVVPMRVVALEWPAAALRGRIAARTERMLAAGLCHEVESLLAAGVSPTCRPMQAVGYREACAVVRGLLPEAELAAAIRKSTWAYARRQRTWLRREINVHTVPVDGLAGAAADVLRLLSA
jgi:tRNA dimethylallyltransferase